MNADSELEEARRTVEAVLASIDRALASHPKPAEALRLYAFRRSARVFLGWLR